MSFRQWSALAIPLLLSTACGVTGSGDIVIEQREVADFARIEVSDGIALRVTVDPEATTDVVVSYDDNVIDQIKTEVVGDTLRIFSEGMYNTFGGEDRHVEVSLSELVGIEASGGSDVVGQGETAMLELEASGGANLDLTTLNVNEMTLQASGGANVTVNVTESITGDASGGADVTVTGDPPQQSIETSGGAEVSYG